MVELTEHNDQLSNREQSILWHVVHNFIQTAVPVGSRFISKHYALNLSPASIRNVMADLEELGFLSHPHTSAGRVPTDLGYRFYIDYLMKVQQLSDQEKKQIHQQLDAANDAEELLRETSRLLGKISRQLSVVTSPHLSSGIFERMELIPVSSSKLLVVISIRSGIVRTIMLEIGVDIKRDHLDLMARMLNDRLSGLTLKEIRDTFIDRVRDIHDDTSGLVRLFIDSLDQLFTDSKERDKLHIGGAKNIIEQPEFVDPQNFRSVIELIENEDIIVHLLEKHEELQKNFVVTVGTENQDASAKDYSVVTATYNVEGVTGRVGLIGPTRMDYAKIIPLVDYVSQAIAKMLGS
ncbi:MAG TPA: heat-inducible transcriptional repressor HrcA [Bacteroidota bacterium]|nr:heat-inducible transcriptional repressor HrcA [Bacteroidota bacterium]